MLDRRKDSQCDAKLFINELIFMHWLCHPSFCWKIILFCTLSSFVYVLKHQTNFVSWNTQERFSKSNIYIISDVKDLKALGRGLYNNI